MKLKKFMLYQCLSVNFRWALTSLPKSIECVTDPEPHLLNSQCDNSDGIPDQQPVAFRVL